MSLYEKMERAMDQRDAGIYAEVLHPDFKFVRHQSGTEMSRDQMIEMLNMMMSNDKVAASSSNSRELVCLYARPGARQAGKASVTCAAGKLYALGGLL